MPNTKEQMNKNEINKFLQNNAIDPQKAMGYNKFETAYHVGDNRLFREETPIIINIVNTSDINVFIPEINDIEFETTFKTTEQDFKYDEDHETLTIIGNESQKHNENYKIVISSIYLEF